MHVVIERRLDVVENRRGALEQRSGVIEQRCGLEYSAKEGKWVPVANPRDAKRKKEKEEKSGGAAGEEPSISRSVNMVVTAV